MDTESIIGMNTSGPLIVCYNPTMISTNGIWQGDSPLSYSLPLFVLQLITIVITTRVLVFLLKPFRQPRVVAEILGGIILGPSVLGNNSKFAHTFFPLRSVMILETMANMGLLYFLFLVGVEMDISVIKRSGRRSVFIAIAGMILPFIIGVAFSLILSKEDRIHRGANMLFFSVSLSVTAFPVLARVLAELKLLNSEIGRLAMSSALINDLCSWIVLVIAIAMSDNNSASMTSLWVVLSSAAFVGFCSFVVKPGIMWIIRKTPEGEAYSEFYICLILTGVMICGFITDALGTHSVFGAFVFGLIIPNGSLGITLIERLEDFISGMLLPLFFALSGLKTNISNIEGAHTWELLGGVIILGCIGKVIGTIVVTSFNKMPLREGLTLGFLMNTKGLVEIIILNLGLSQRILNDESFAIMVVVSLVMTAAVTPVVSFIYKPIRKGLPYKRRTIESSKKVAEFRILICVHNTKNTPTMVSLLDVSHPSKKSPICAYVVHLVELTGRASAMLIVHHTRRSGRTSVNRTQAQTDTIIQTFEAYEQQADFVSVQPLTAISPYSTMHEDICTIAEDKKVALIIIPFHKQPTVDGSMETTNPSYRTIYQNVMTHAPCSVGVLVDRGFVGSARTSSTHVYHRVAVLFFGGRDDREALAYAWRMADHSRIMLTVMRFIEGETSRAGEKNSFDEKALDEIALKQFRSEKMVGTEMVTYTEQMVNNGEETMTAIKNIDSTHDLFIVGRGDGGSSSVTSGLTDWSECPELGPIGDSLASSDFSTMVSVLVIQQYDMAGEDSDGGSSSPSSPNDNVYSIQMNHRQASSPEKPVFQSHQESLQNPFAPFSNGWHS